MCFLLKIIAGFCVKNLAETLDFTIFEVLFMSTTNSNSGKGAGIATTTPTNAKALTVVSKTKEEIKPNEDNGKTVVNVNVTNTANAEATATASAKVDFDIHTQISKFEKLRELMKQRSTLNEGRDKISKIILVSNEKNPLKVAFSDVELEADDYTFYNDNLVRNTAEFVIGEFNRKLAEIEAKILSMKIA